MRLEPGQRIEFTGGWCLENGSPDPIEVEPMEFGGGWRITRPADVNRAEQTKREYERMLMMQPQAMQTREWQAGMNANQGDMLIGHPDMIARLRAITQQAGAAPARDVLNYSHQAQRRARALLLRHLNLTQRRSYKDRGAFVVKGNRSGIPYRINSTGRVIRTTDDHEFCLQVVGEPVPPEDAILARKILIETNEQLFLDTANDLTEGPRVPDRIAGMREIRRLEAELMAQREQAHREAEARAQLNRRYERDDISVWRQWLQDRGL